MSLASLALRVCACQALKGGTLAGDNVFDSAIDTLDELIGSDPAPVLIVSIDEGKGEGPERDWLSGESSVTLLFETAIASVASVAATNGDGEETVVNMSATSEGLEASLDILWRQICRALLVPAGRGSWQDLFQRFAMRWRSINRKRGGGAEGIRFAARYYLVEIEPLSEPDFGGAPAGPWADLIAAMRNVPDLVDLADTLAREIAAPEDLTAWQQAQARLGVSDEGMRAGTGLAPFAATDTDEAAVGDAAAELTEVVIDPNGVSSTDAPIAD
jgi:hypothetical protein